MLWRNKKTETYEAVRLGRGKVRKRDEHDQNNKRLEDDQNSNEEFPAKQINLETDSPRG